jgi:mannose-6-phosphate isomerase
VSRLIALQGVIRPYAWGSPTAIPELLGISPTGQPAAELWLGAHPDDPSFAPEHGTTLDRLIAADPVGLLGAAVAERFDGRLPFLFKVLAADKALSIQVHPDLAQARAGYADEDARGVPRDSPERNYKDPNHKPELLCALTEFDALCGFRPVARTLALVDALDVAELAPYRALLAGPDGLRAAFTALLTLHDPKPLVEAVVAGARRVYEGPWAAAARATLVAAGDFPGDVGAVLALLLNTVRLRPGQAIFLGAGNVHAYLRGVGVEIMANSDNVLRCGLTPKHVDVAELLRIADFTELADPVWPSVDGRFVVPVPDFTLSIINLDGSHQIPAGSPQILLCTSGAAGVSAGGDAVALRRGSAAFVAAGNAVTVSGTGTVFRACPNVAR